MANREYSKTTNCRYRLAAVLLLVIAAAGCGPSSPKDDAWSGPTAATLGDQSILTIEQYRQLPEYKNSNVEWGQRLSQQCRACHTFDRGGPHMIGPNLYRFLGSRAGSQDEFPYSRALTDSTFVWTPRALDAWLAAPGEFLPGNSMVFAGVADQPGRDALIGYLLELAGDESN